MSEPEGTGYRESPDTTEGSAPAPDDAPEGSATLTTDDEAQRLEVQGGLKIISVDEGSPASIAGLQIDDVLLSLDNAPITSRDDLQIALRKHRPEDYVTVWYLRNGERQPLYAVLVERNAG